MKILAIEKEVQNADWTNTHGVLEEEARHVYALQQSGDVREIYFTETHSAVLVLECEDIGAAKTLLGDFPLVKAALISFDVMALMPYTGLDRLMNGQPR